MTLSIIIVNWNSAAFVRDCLQSLARRSVHAGVEVIVVDSGSFDGCVRMVAAEFPWVRFIQVTANVGFARANNIGASRAAGDHLLFLNPDTLLHEDSPALLVRRLDSLPHAGAIGCRLLNRDGSLQTSCVQAFPTVLNQALDAQWLRDCFPRWSLWGTQALHGRTWHPAQVEAVSGACLAVKRAAFEAVGGFSEDYFMYGEDLDLCRKLRRAGWRVYYTPETSLTHFGGASSRQAPGNFSVVMMRESVQRFLRLHEGPGAATAYRVAMGISALFRLAFIGPALLFGDRIVRHGPSSARKWLAVLRWSVGGATRAQPPRAAPVRAPVAT